MTDPPETVDITPEREFAQHMAFRLLDDASAALIEGRSGSIRIPRLDPEFGAVVGTSMGVIAWAVRNDRLPRDFIADTQTSTAPAEDKKSSETTAPRHQVRINNEQSIHRQ